MSDPLEVVFASNDKYCGRFLMFETGASIAAHFHAQKDKTWVVLAGKFAVKWIDTADATPHEEILNQNDIWRSKPMFVHQLECLEEGTIVEVSSPDVPNDLFLLGKI